MDLSACAAEINKAALEPETRASQIETNLSADRIATVMGPAVLAGAINLPQIRQTINNDPTLTALIETAPAGSHDSLATAIAHLASMHPP